MWRSNHKVKLRIHALKHKTINKLRYNWIGEARSLTTKDCFRKSKQQTKVN